MIRETDRGRAEMKWVGSRQSHVPLNVWFMWGLVKPMENETENETAKGQCSGIGAFRKHWSEDRFLKEQASRDGGSKREKHAS